MAETYLTSLVLWNHVAVGEAVVTVGERERNQLVDIAARACRASDKVHDFAAQLEGLIERLRRWLSDHFEKINAAYLSVRDEDLLFLIVQKNARFDADLTDSLTELDLLIANSPDLGLVDLEVMEVPPLSTDSLRSLLSASTILFDAK